MFSFNDSRNIGHGIAVVRFNDGAARTVQGNVFETFAFQTVTGTYCRDHKPNMIGFWEKIEIHHPEQAFCDACYKGKDCVRG